MDDKTKILVENYAQAHGCDFLSTYLALKEKPDKVAVRWVVDAKVKAFMAAHPASNYPQALPAVLASDSDLKRLYANS